MPAFTAASSADSTTGAGPDRPRCSAKGCGLAATWALHWRNPSLHAEARVKTWLSCDTHREHLADFLARRGFLLDTRPLTAATATPEQGDTDPGSTDRTDDPRGH